MMLLLIPKTNSATFYKLRLMNSAKITKIIDIVINIMIQLLQQHYIAIQDNGSVRVDKGMVYG